MNNVHRIDPGNQAPIAAMNAGRAAAARDEIRRNRRTTGWTRRSWRGRRER